MSTFISYLNYHIYNTDVIKYSNNQYKEFTLHSQRQYVVECLNNNNKELFGIFDHNFHIGNILIYGIKSHHKRAEITFVLGEKSYWNKGVMTYVISKIIKISKNIYKLNKIFAASSSKNIAALKVLEKNNFVV